MSEDMKVICDVKEKVLDLLRQANQAKEFSMGDVDFLYKAIKAVKNAGEVEEMMEEGGYSQGGDWMAEGNYGRGSSYANRGQHYVRGHYSRDGHDDYSESRRDSRGRYSREDGRDKMIGHLKAAWDDAPEKDRQEFMRYLENA